VWASSGVYAASAADAGTARANAASTHAPAPHTADLLKSPRLIFAA
jgi:hypothetical protein